MKLRNIIIAGLIAIILILIWLFVREQKRAELKDSIIRRLEEENEELKANYIDLLIAFMEAKNLADKSIINDLEELKKKSDHLGSSIHVELEHAIEMMREGKGTKAVKEIAKIVEHLLKEKISKETEKPKNSSLAVMLSFAKDKRWIQPHEEGYGHLIRQIRNKESHEVGVKVENHVICLAIYSGIQIIYGLG